MNEIMKKIKSILEKELNRYVGISYVTSTSADEWMFELVVDMEESEELPLKS